jgi:tetratricopeptide (TPR) repeat protein
MSVLESDAGRLRIMYFALFLSTLLLFSRAVGCDFLDFDDPDFLTQNARVQSGLHWQSVREAFTSSDAGNWYPLTRLSHVIAWQFWGADPRGHHAINVIVHAFNAVLAFLVFKRLTRVFWTSAGSAALFAWHPLRVESVAWIAERKDVLSVFFGLITLWAYAVYTEKNSARHTSAWRWYGLALTSFTAGLLCKPMLVTLPFVLLLLDLWPLERSRLLTTPARDSAARLGLTALLYEKIPYLILSVGSCFITYLIQKQDGAITEQFPLNERLANTAVSAIRYLGKFFYPIDLSTPYAHPDRWPLATIICSVFALLIIIGASLCQFRTRPWLLVGLFWFLGMLIPVIGLVQSGLQAMADRYTYLPSLGLQLALLWSIKEYAQFSAKPWLKGLMAAIVLAGCATLTWRQIGYWKNSITLFEHTLAVSENNYMAQSYLGTSLANAGKLDSATTHYRRALELSPTYPAAHYGLAVALEKQGLLDEALQHYMQAVRIRPNYPQAHYGLGLAFLKLDQPAKARLSFQTAADCDPDFALAQRGLGLVAARTKNFQEASRYFQRALAIDPRSSDINRDYARILAAENRHTDACAYFQAALRANPLNATIHYELGLSLQATDHEIEAEKCYIEAIRLNPAFAEAHYNLGVMLINRGQTAEAISYFHSAADSQPDFGLAYFGLGLTAAQTNQTTEAITYYRKALIYLSDNAEVHNALGHALSSIGRREEALSHWEQAYKLDPTIDGLAEALSSARKETANHTTQPQQP